jgi:hypothetical protein
MSDEQADDTSMPFVKDEYLRSFLEGKEGYPGQADFPDKCQLVSAEMNRRLVRQQVKVLAAQEILAKSLTRATWVLSVATIVLAFATLFGPLLWRPH